MSDFDSGADFTPYIAMCPVCESTYLRDQPWKRICLSCYLRTKGKAAPPARQLPAPAFDKAMMRRLLQLCHPDRHGNSEASNVATRFLLQLKGAAHE